MTARRGHNEGTIYRRPNGKFQAQISLPDGTRKTFTAATKRDVQRLLQEAKLSTAQGITPISERRKVAEYLDWWLETITPSIRYSTVRSYATNIDGLDRHIGRVRLDALTPMHIQTCYSKLLAEGLSPRSVELAHVVLHASLRHAVKLGLLRANPTDAVVPPRPGRRELATLTTDELGRLFAAAPTPGFKTLLMLLSTSGLRIGEALGLKWSDVDLDGRSLAVRRAIQRQRGKGLVFIETKTAASRRTVHLTSMVVDALLEHRARQERERYLVGRAWRETDVVFASGVGTPLNPENISQRFQRVVEQAGVSRIS